LLRSSPLPKLRCLLSLNVPINHVFNKIFNVRSQRIEEKKARRRRRRRKMMFYW